MPNNVYIGNRYVPIFANPVEWDNLREYEPLTIVTYQGTAYTSRQTVPVGTALSNTQYWVVTGNYNAQVEEYRQEVASLSDDVDGLETDLGNLSDSVDNRFTAVGNRIGDVEDDVAEVAHINYYKNKSFLILGDSLSDELYGPSLPCWVATFRTLVTGSGGSVTNYSASGRSLSAVRNDNIIAHLSDIPAGNYTDIIVFLGVNDWASSATFTQITTALDSLKNWVDQTHPDAVVHFVSPVKCADSYNASIPIDYYRGVMCKQINRYGWYHVDAFSEAPNYNGGITFNADRWTLDGIHFKPAYAPLFANYMFARIKTRCSTFNANYVTDVTIGAASGFTVVCYYHSDGKVNIYCNCGSSFTPPGIATEITTLPAWLIPILPVSTEGYSIANGKKDFLGGYIRSDNGKLYVTCGDLSNSHSPTDFTFEYYVNPMFRPNL